MKTYAKRVMNLIDFSKHQRTQCTHFIANLANIDEACSSLVRSSSTTIT